MNDMPKNILWKAPDGKEFHINVDELNLKTMEEVHEHIQMLREKYGYKKPIFSHVTAGPGRTLEQYGIDAVDVSTLPEHLRGDVFDVIKEQNDKVCDPKKLN